MVVGQVYFTPDLEGPAGLVPHQKHFFFYTSYHPYKDKSVFHFNPLISQSPSIAMCLPIPPHPPLPRQVRALVPRAVRVGGSHQLAWLGGGSRPDLEHGGAPEVWQEIICCCKEDAWSWQGRPLSIRWNWNGKITCFFPPWNRRCIELKKKQTKLFKIFYLDCHQHDTDWSKC